MAKRPTIADLARETGLGVATIDRALNGRPNVSERTLRRVAEAADKIGYHSRGLAKFRVEAASRPKVRLGFLLQKRAHDFYQAFADTLSAACAARQDYRIEPRISFADTQDAGALADLVERAAGEADALAVVVPNLPKVTARLRALRAGGLPVFTLLNDIGEGDRDGYFGTDNIKVGRIAAWMLTTKVRRPCKLAVFVGHARWHSHMLREAGFQSYLREHAPGFEMLGGIVNLDIRQVTHEAVVDVLQRHPDLGGIYVAGGGMEGAISALRELRPPDRVALVTQEMTPQSQAALGERYVSMVLETPVQSISRDVVDAMLLASEGHPFRRHRAFDPLLHCPESV